MKTKEIYIPIALFFLFFVFQVFFYNHEILITLFCILICMIIFWIKYNKGEDKLFLFGFILGILIELGLGLIARTQYWSNASLYGIPYWLPIVWGMGFVVITRVGILIRK